MAIHGRSLMTEKTEERKVFSGSTQKGLTKAFQSLRWYKFMLKDIISMVNRSLLSRTMSIIWGFKT